MSDDVALSNYADNDDDDSFCQYCSRARYQLLLHQWHNRMQFLVQCLDAANDAATVIGWWQ